MLAEGRSLDDALAMLPEPEVTSGATCILSHVRHRFRQFQLPPETRRRPRQSLRRRRVRRAFALAVDKQAIVRGATRLNEPVVNALIPPGSIPGYHCPAGLSMDRARAAAELAAAGWIDRDHDGVIETPGEAFPD